ncbi:MAG: hypothetical protein JO010_03600, partial [Alphaproteobacteria bacterium]|nr:hypothetical protein [Alphaproteobacteria bacterium]
MFRKLLLAAALLVPGVAHADWYEASTAHFVVYSNDKPETVQQYATNLERFDKALHFLRSLPDTPVAKVNRVTVYIVDNIAAIQALSHNDSAAGFYLGRAGDSAAFVPRNAGEKYVDADYRDMMLTPQQILLHEYTHHFLLNLSPNVAYPGWFVEGYAEFFATVEFEADGSVIFGHPPQYRAWGMFGETPLPTNRLLIADTLKLSDEEEVALYTRGWLLTHYLFLGGKRDGQLGAYFQALTNGTPPLEAAKVFGDLNRLDSELWAYKRTDFAANRIPASVLPVGTVELRKLGAGEAATMPVQIRIEGSPARDADSIYAEAQAAAAPYPNDAAAQDVLAGAALHAGQFAAAEAAADRVLAADPNNVDALLVKASARLQAAVKAGDKAPETWGAIRKLIGAANHLDEDNPQA